MKIQLCVLLLLVSTFQLHSQIGGRFGFESASLPSNARVSALGGSVINILDGDVALAQMNPALTNADMHHQFSFNHNFGFAGIGNGNVAYGLSFDSLGLQTHAAISYVNYGDFQRADIIGNTSGTFSAGETSVIIGAAKQVNERMRIGANVKFLTANYEDFGAFGLGLDLGLHYHKPGSSSSWAIVLRNIGSEINGIVDETRSLPFDLQLGFSNRLAHLPFRFSIIAHQLQQWYIRFDDPDRDIQSNIIGEETEISEFSKQLDNFFRHFIFNGEFLIGKAEQLRIRVGYNHFRKQELRVVNFRSLAGFSFGVGFNIKKIKIDYGVGYYHIAGATNHLSMRLDLERIFNKI